MDLLGQFDLRDVETTIRIMKAITQGAQQESESAA